jgi:hypothetical protein
MGIKMIDESTVIRVPALQAVVRSQFASAVKGSVAAQRAASKAAQDIEAEVRAPKTAGTESRKRGQDVNDVIDDELMAIANQDKTEV